MAHSSGGTLLDPPADDDVDHPDLALDAGLVAGLEVEKSGGPLAVVIHPGQVLLNGHDHDTGRVAKEEIEQPVGAQLGLQAGSDHTDHVHDTGQVVGLGAQVVP